MELRKYLILFFLLFSLNVLAEQTKLNDKVSGIWFGPNQSDNWIHQVDAVWIWTDEKPESDAILARKIFSLYDGFEKVILRITASSQYQLYINGEYVCRGPARSAPHHQSYDVLDITKMMNVGENLIAVRVHHQKGKHSYQYEGRAGLLAKITYEQGDVYGIIPSDSSWKVIPDSSWDNMAPKINRFQQAVNDRVDFRNYLNGWKSLDFNDSNWKAATELMRKTGWPAPQKNASAQPLTPPWTSLVPRDIPYLTERNIKAGKLIEAIEINTSIVDKAHSLTGQVKLNNQETGILEIPVCSDSKSWLLVYDFGEVINGMPRLDILGRSGTEVEIIAAPFMVDRQFTHITVDSEFRDKIILSGQRDKWEATYFKPTRYLGIVVSNDTPVKLFSAGIHQIKYPFERKGIMNSEDASWINSYFEATAKTIDVCTTDAFTDNYRERRQYAQTGYYAALGNYWIFGDYALQRRYLIQVAQEQLANGIMPAYAPLATDDYMIILDSNCLWIRSLYNYFMYSGDEKTVRELIPVAQKLIDLLHSFTFDLYFIDNPPYAYWLDHAQNDRRGANLCLNGHYLGALTDYAELLRYFNMDTSELEYQIKAAKLSYTHFWNEEKQLYSDAVIDGKLSPMYSEQGNAMALSTNNVWTEEAELAAKQLLVNDKHNYIKRESGITMVTPAMSYFLHKGLCNYGFIDESFELFRNRFDKMLQPEYNGTLWEEWWLDGTGRSGKFQGGRTRSDAQTESAFAPALFAEFLFGIKVTKPGMKELEITRYETNIANIEGSIPTPYGNVNVEWNIHEDNGELELNIPSGITINLNPQNLNISNEGIAVNGEKREENPDAAVPIKLTAGAYKITF
jgi:hypothetical protein